MKYAYFSLFLAWTLSFQISGKAQTAKDKDYNTLSEDFIKALVRQSSAASYLSALAAADPKTLEQQLNTDEKRKAFWINVYNGLIISKLSVSPELFKNKGKFFSKKQFVIAGKKVSLDKIEHGIIRRSRKKLSLGYLKKWFPSRFEKRFWIDKIDGRIHYALNCGAKSCPPVQIYTPTNFETAINTATKAYLQKHVSIDEATQEIHLPVLFSWFIADFGGREGVRDFLVRYEILNESNKSTYTIKYLDYDWTLDISNFQEHLLGVE